MGRDEYEMLILLRIGVSIHTPVWGVTATNVVKVPDTKVSIHTPVWGVTLPALEVLPAVKCFNPHARVGRDYLLLRNALRLKVSIHTPVWGVTSVTLTLFSVFKFQSTRPCGA